MEDRIGIISTGSYIPKKILKNAELEKIVNTTDQWITERTGIKERRIADKDETTSYMAGMSAVTALKKTNLDPKDIDLIIVGTSTPDMFFPSTACAVQREINAPNAAAFDVMAACSGFVFALHTAYGLMRAENYKNALVIGSEKMSAVLDWKDRGTCILFGDGAGACVLSRVKSGAGIIAVDISSGGEHGDLLYLPAVGMNYNDNYNVKEMHPHHLKMNGKSIFKLAVSNMYHSVLKIMDKTKTKKSDISMFIPHQANIRIIESLGEKLGINKEHTFINVDKYGNMASASIPVALDEAIAQNKIKKGDIVLLTTFGGGITCGSCIFEL